jgi:uncharacterized protein (UPF0548 family)
MFVMRRPSSQDIERFLTASRSLPLSYDPVGIATQNPPGFRIDEHSAIVGYGDAAFERAKAALTRWKHFELGWVELFPKNAPIGPGSVVVVLVSHLGFWSLNGCRVVYAIGADQREFGFANTETGAVAYSIRAASRPRAALAQLGYPLTRALQARFRHDSARAVARAICG